MKRFLFMIVLLSLAGCAAWVQTGGLYKSEAQNFSVDLPQGWMRLNEEGSLLLTRDGVLLQNIRIGRLKIDYEFKHTKKKLAKDMLPQETAEVILDNINSDPAYFNFELLENSPAQISGLPGFKLLFTYKTQEGLRLKSIYYGLISGEWFFYVRYDAPVRHYFDKYFKTFERVIESFKLIKA